MIQTLRDLTPDQKAQIVSKGNIIRAIGRKMKVSHSLVSRVLKGTQTSARVAAALIAEINGAKSR